MIFTVLFVALLCLLTFYYFSVSTYSYWKNRNVPFLKPVPLLGNFKNVFLMKECIAHALQRLYQNFPDAKYIGIYQGRRPALLLRDPELIKSVMVKDFEHFTDRVAVTADIKREPILRNLSNMSGDEWKMLRQVLTPAFTSSKMKNMFTMLKDCTEELMQMFEENSIRELDIKEYMKSYMIDIIGCCVFGIQISSLKDEKSEFRYMARQIFTPLKFAMFKRLCRSYFPFISKLFNFRTFPSEIEEFFFNLMNEVIEKRDQSQEKRVDFLQLLLDMRNNAQLNGDNLKDSLEITQSLITSQSFIFFLAGLETTSTTLSFCLYELAVNPVIQDELFTHIDKALKGNPNFSVDDIFNIAYLDEVLLETERKYPAVPLTTRRCTKKYNVPDTDLKLSEGDNVIIPIYAIHHDPLYYPDPEKFDPDRFSSSKSHRNNSLFLTFGLGPRFCMAGRFARLVMMTALTRIVQKFKILPSKKTPKIEFDKRTVFLLVKGGLWLELEER